MARIKRKLWLAQYAKRRQQAVKAHKRGDSMESIADHFGVTRQRISQWLKFEASKTEAK